MTKFLTGAAALALLAACETAGTEDAASVAEAYTPPATLAEATEGASEVAMWRVGDGDTTVTLIGTVHLLREGTEWKRPAYEAAFAEADAVYLEADVLSPEAQAEVQALIPELGMNPPGTTLASYFDEDELVRLNAAMAPLGVSTEQLAPFRPWFAGITLGVLGIQQVGGTPEAGVETLIASDAAAAGKPLRYLETAAEQLRILAGDDDATQADFMLVSADQMDDLEGYFAGLIGAWYDGRPDVVGDIVNEGFEAFPTIAEALLYRRNEDWAEQIGTLIETEEGEYLVAVGAGHLAGDRSLQDYLAERGYEAERL